jgi:hypothetical protein
MPKFLEDKLKAEYPGNLRAVYSTMNKIGAMKGNKETAKGRAMQQQHGLDQAAELGSPQSSKGGNVAKAGRGGMKAKANGESNAYNWRNRHGQAKVKAKL